MCCHSFCNCFYSFPGVSTITFSICLFTVMKNSLFNLLRLVGRMLFIAFDSNFFLQKPVLYFGFLWSFMKSSTSFLPRDVHGIKSKSQNNSSKQFSFDWPIFERNIILLLALNRWMENRISFSQPIYFILGWLITIWVLR